MKNRLSPANLIARSAARFGPLTLLAVLAAAAVLFAIYVYPAYAQEGSAPDKPTGLGATATHDSVTLTWNDPQDESITGYVILRRVRVNDTGGDFSVLVADTGSAATTYTDNTVAASTTYTYRIKAINEHGRASAPAGTTSTPQRRRSPLSTTPPPALPPSPGQPRWAKR